jgi:hypothetical protein
MRYMLGWQKLVLVRTSHICLANLTHTSGLAAT